MNSPAPSSHVVILCHPAPDSFNAAVATRYCETVRQCGQQAVLRDLYAMHFDPVLRAEEQPGSADFVVHPDVLAERALIADAKVVVLVYPIWLGSPPAMLKGYVERVFCTGLAGKDLLSFSSSGNSQVWLEEQGEWQSLLHLFDRYIRHAFAMGSTEHVHFRSVVKGMNERFFSQNMEDVRQAATRACRESAAP
ncbi:NAD(P)H-dependent oxidoreductase [Novosphingobium sp. FSW06-99]|jgi:NAD(P)H dehydrogenase (quinone)|uniref:NAD(P)H-dependent oxidoreductase n=1 Tax=Novosphingobium sp. FSW06-99 TaxID=1739113 RepID=UPI0009E9140A|nr:NAD(P)H-dependent oxidoreductase [Novosphingobium sp. FSW06-99]